jgi:hypothetical protein
MVASLWQQERQQGAASGNRNRHNDQTVQIIQRVNGLIIVTIEYRAYLPVLSVDLALKAGR